jgi:hypothetical protein
MTTTSVPYVPLIGAYIAARTKRLRIATGVIARKGVRWLLRSYVNPSLPGTYVNPRSAGRATETILMRDVESVVIHRTSDVVMEKLSRLGEDIGMEYVIIAPLSLQTFVSFMDQVLPRLADQ